jgi:hypothetical protein
MNDDKQEFREVFYMFGKEKKENRFVVKEEQSLGFGAVYIVVDTMTGVNYLTTVGNGMNGITPLLDSDGNVIIDR